MAESLASLPKDPSLKRYFKFMLTNRKMSVQFTSRKIREIIESDLGIILVPPQSLYARVCIEAFAYYMQSWPEWNLAIKSQYSDTLYECLINYLRNKLLYLKQSEQVFKQSSIEKNTLTLPRPENIQISPQHGMKKVKAPYCLKVNIPESLWNFTKVTLRNYGTHHIYLEFGKYPNIQHSMGFKDLLNHPFVDVEFCLPGLIHFTRSSPFKIERFLQTMSDEPFETDSNHIISVVDSNTKSPHKVYTYHLMTVLFNALKRTLELYKIEVGDTQRKQITDFCEEFAFDIFESNLNYTVCEGSTVNYNIGKSTYFTQSELNTHNSLNEKLVFRELITPVISYNLISCDITQENITEDSNFEYFKFSQDIDKVFFIHRIKNCLKFKCAICDVYFTYNELKKHLIDAHPTSKKIRCVKCSKRYTVSKMFGKRWRHECSYVPPLSDDYE